MLRLLSLEVLHILPLPLDSRLLLSLLLDRLLLLDLTSGRVRLQLLLQIQLQIRLTGHSSRSCRGQVGRRLMLPDRSVGLIRVPRIELAAALHCGHVLDPLFQRQ
jgi:hypothetical protein